MAALNHRITLRVHIDGMDLAETVAYIHHHLTLSAGAPTRFS
jgi:type II secretory pathway predicted ATPase ExeA